MGQPIKVEFMARGPQGVYLLDEYGTPFALLATDQHR